MSKSTPIEDSAAATLKRLEQKDPGLKQLLKKAYGYAVFPSVGKAALVVGGSYGKGAVYERGKLIGYATIAQTTAGVQVGGDTFSELIVFESKESMERLKKGKMSFAADASAVLVKAGAAAAKGFGGGAQAFVYSSGGMLVEAVIGGQKFKFKPVGEDQEENQKDEQAGKAKQAQQDDESAEPESSHEEGAEEEGADEDGSEEEGSGAMEDQSSLFTRAAGGVRDAASRASEFVKEHPLASTLIGAGIASGLTFTVYRALRATSTAANGSASSDEASHDESDDDPETSEMMAEHETDSADEESDEQEDTGSQRRPAGAGRARR